MGALLQSAPPYSARRAALRRMTLTGHLRKVRERAWLRLTLVRPAVADLALPMHERNEELRSLGADYTRVRRQAGYFAAEGAVSMIQVASLLASAGVPPARSCVPFPNVLSSG